MITSSLLRHAHSRHFSVSDRSGAEDVDEFDDEDDD